MPEFSHLHVHTQYSLLDGAASIAGLMKKTKAEGMKAIALTDHGNMFGAFNFVAEANKHGIKPIVGCEFYMVEDRFKKQFSKENKDNRFHQLLLAKDQEGYKNLSKLCSLGYIEGLYSKWPRIDKDLVLKYHKGLIATTCCIGAEVPQAILNKGEEAGEIAFKWWLDLFGEDYYIELQRHNLPEQEQVNAVLLKFAKKYQVKIIASNDSHYIDQQDSNAHDILLCVNTGELQQTPIGEGKGYRFGFPNNQFYFKSPSEMASLFKDLPQALDNTGEIVDKITPPVLKRDILLPNFVLPPNFATMDDYLKHLSYQGAVKRYGEITAEIEERLNFELQVIKTMGFAGYFLIVQDFIAAGRNIGVSVGPGRGSAAGSCVAFCIGITNIDPIKYSLLFERFLNPERVTMPDIDIDFDDEGRQKVIDYVVNKYGKNQVAQIITFGTMAAKSSIKDVARTLDLPLADANYLAKLVPDTPGTTLEGALSASQELATIKSGSDIKADVINLAMGLEGSVRNTGIHAAGIIIAPDDITNYIPVSTSKDSDLLVTQFDGKVIESAGMLKMDFLGLKTLTIIRDALLLIKKNHHIDINIDDIPMDDLPTYKLYQRGDTIGTFQFESEGMRSHLKELKPTNIEDLIAMNALFRPGPMQYIPNFINRKHGREKVEYPHPLLEPILNNTYGIMVYQEQIMQTAQIIAGYSLGGADLLRRAMGKKDKEKMAKERVKFVEGAMKIHQIPEAKSNEIFDVMEKFAEYGFNRSHSAAYSVVAFQTAFLKANYPAEYMASVLTHNMSQIEKISFFMDECKKQSIQVLGPDVNESTYYFDVNSKSQIRFGLGAIKGTGEAAVSAVIAERNKGGNYKNIFDFAERVDLRVVNKKTFESFAYAGVFDSFPNMHRAQYFFTPQGDTSPMIEKAIKYGSVAQQSKAAAQVSLFGEATGTAAVLPKIANCEEWSNLEKLKFEKEVVGFYISGHPLDQYRIDISQFCNCPISKIKESVGKDVSFAGIVTKSITKQTKTGKTFGSYTVEDFDDSIEVTLFGEDFVKFQQYFTLGQFLYLKGRYQSTKYNPNMQELKINSIMLLQDVRSKMIKSIQLLLSLDKLNKEIVNEIEKTIVAHPGSCTVNIKLNAPEQKMQLDMVSRKYKVEPSNEFIDNLSLLDGVAYKLL
jgi:DNA polymerase-3 subunit alpha